MLRMIQSQSVEQAKDYHNEALLQSDYYMNDTEIAGSFNGRLAKRIGINGPANKFVFDALCENINPATLKSLTPRNSKVRTVGYDINFHCPKSVSVLHVLSSDNHILEAFRASVQQTMLEIEAHGKTRVRKNGKDEDRATGELIWTDFIHQTARPVKVQLPDPHLHCHCFTFNATFDPVENQIKAGQFRDIKRDMPYYEARFHKRLADNLVALGYQVRPTKTSFEVIGVPQPVIDLLSKRTNEIGQIAKENKITDAKELDKLGARTRAKKQKGLSMAELKEAWRKQIRELNVLDNNKTIRFAKDVKPELVTPTACMDHAVLHHFERASVVQDRRILATAYRFGIGKAGASIAQIDHAFNSHDIISVADGSRLLCTTKEVLQEEQRMIDFAKAGQGMFAPFYTYPSALSLQGEQADAANHVLTAPDQVSVIMGGAGTGKTTLMKETIAMVEKSGKRVIVVAPTAQASRGVLRKEGFVDAETVAKLLVSPELQQRLQDQVIWVDEAGLLGTKDMTALLELATKYKTRVILSGDTRQHASVVRGDALRILTTSAGIVAAGVNTIYRQRVAEYRQSVHDLSKGNVKAAFAGFERMGAIKVSDPANGHHELVNDYMTAIEKGKTALIVSPTHLQGEAVTTAIRDKLKQTGKIDAKETMVTRLVNLNLTEAEKRESRFLQPGHVLQFNQNWQNIARGCVLSVMQVTSNSLVLADENRKLHVLPINSAKGFEVYRKAEIGLSKGDMITITRNGIDNNKQALNNGQMLEIVSATKGEITACHPESNIEYILPGNYGHLSYGYCMTSHASQGKTVDEVFVVQPSSTFPATSMQQFYVSTSRARDRVHIYTDNKSALLDEVSQSGDRMSVQELLRKQNMPEWA